MSRNGVGVYQLPSPPSPYVNGTTADATQINQTLNDIAAALTQSWSADGQTPVTGNLNMGGHSITDASAISTTGTLTGANVTTTNATCTTSTVNGGEHVFGSLQVDGHVTLDGSTTGSVANAGGLQQSGVVTGVTAAITYAINSTVGSVVAPQFWATSDARQKTEIAEIDADTAVAWIMNAHPVTYLKEGVQEAGFIAQDDVRNGRGSAVKYIQDGRPQFAESDGIAPPGTRLVRHYDHDIAFLTRALQDALQRIAALEGRL